MSDVPRLLSFDVETSRVLRILASEIYDSPHALLRENVQNAYDAVLMRVAEEGGDATQFKVEVTLDGRTLTVRDEGIGMTEDVLQNNFWRAGSSGKRNALAQRAGVVGTFGIGAMANFGVCKTIRVETRALGSATTLISTADRDTLKIGEPCISMTSLHDDRAPGTTLVAELDDGTNLTAPEVERYLLPYVQFLPIAVTVNGKKLSQQNAWETLVARQAPFSLLASTTVGDPLDIHAVLQIYVNPQHAVAIRLLEIQCAGSPVPGTIMLRQGGGQTMAYRNRFGLAPIPLSSHYDFGGYVNMSILTPTAGREALSRESIQVVTRFVEMAERFTSIALAETEHADRNGFFLNYVSRRFDTNLVRRVKIELHPSKKHVELGSLASFEAPKPLLYYTGTDANIIHRFATEEANLAVVQQSEPKRRMQIAYLRAIGVQEVPDQILCEPIADNHLDIATAMSLLRISAVLVQDYLLPDPKVHVATISHGVSVHVVGKSDQVSVYISKTMPGLKMLAASYQNARDVFEPIVKDFVRESLYPRVRDFVPSSTKDGRDALVARLRQNKELFRIDESDLGDVESLLKDYLSGNKDLGDILRAKAHRVGGQRLSVASGQVGKVEEEIPNLDGGARSVSDGSEPLPPILRAEASTDKKLLTVKEDYPRLNNHHVFLALSDAMMRIEGDFFRYPHTTRAIWGGHRVIFIFTEPTGGLSLYYDIQLLEQLETIDTGGRMLPSTTIITQRRIFIPVPQEIEKAFVVQQGYKEFFVRFDTIS